MRSSWACLHGDEPSLKLDPLGLGRRQRPAAVAELLLGPRQACQYIARSHTLEANETGGTQDKGGRLLNSQLDKGVEYHNWGKHREPPETTTTVRTHERCKGPLWRCFSVAPLTRHAVAPAPATGLEVALQDRHLCRALTAEQTASRRGTRHSFSPRRPWERPRLLGLGNAAVLPLGRHALDPATAEPNAATTRTWRIASCRALAAAANFASRSAAAATPASRAAAALACWCSRLSWRVLASEMAARASASSCQTEHCAKPSQARSRQAHESRGQQDKARALNHLSE